MSHHAFFVAGPIEQGIEEARTYLEKILNIDANNNTDLVVLRHGLFSVEDARKVAQLASLAPTQGTKKGIIIGAERVFHEAQNALLKVFEEPPDGTVLVLVVSSEGVIIPTLRSRLLALPTHHTESYGRSMSIEKGIGEAFVEATKTEREKMVEKLLARAKSEKQEEKQKVRSDAILIAEALVRAGYSARTKESDPALTAFLSDLERFIPILHERSAPLKLIFAHLLLIIPRSL